MTTIEALRHLITSLAHYGSDGEGYEGSQEGHAQGVFNHIHGLVRICSWPLLDCLIDSVWLIFLLVWVVVGAWGLLGAPGSRRSPIGLPWGAFRGPPEPAGTWPKILKHIFVVEPL